MNAEMSMVMKRNEDREALRSIIQQWNANRLDLFELSEPNEDLDFHGVMRFYFQDSGQKVATKCIRVASDATAQNVIETLIEKFRPDMRMLSLPEYALFEIHENGEERKLSMDEKPLLVQLNWHKDDREGRFLLRNIEDKTNMPSSTFQEGGSSFRRKLSKREKKQLKKQEKLNRLKSSAVNDENDARVAEKLYTELPETSFTRSISNPEAVMRRRRQQQLESKLQEFRSKDGGLDTGGTLKIYGESLCRDVPYKTLLLSIRDTAQQVVKEMLNKYGLEKEDPHNYCLVQVNGSREYMLDNSKEGLQNNINNNNTLKNNNMNNSNNSNNSSNTSNSQEYILDDDECPLAILMTHRQSHGSIMFHVRRRPADYHPRKRKKKPLPQKWNQQCSNELLEYRYEDGLDRLPFLLELNPDGSDIITGAAKRHRLHPNVTEIGCERATSQGQSQYLQLFGPNIQSRHCVVANTEGIVTVTPCSRDSETYVNGQRIYETTILQNGGIVKFGRIHCFRFFDPCFEDRIRQRHDSSRNINDYVYDRQTSRDDNCSITTTETQRISSSQNVDPQAPHNYETTFDVDGNVETRSTSSQGNKDETRSQRSIGSNSREGNRLPNSGYLRGGTDPILPSVLEIREETEEALLHAIITDLDPAVPSFKLAPAYCLYLMARYRASTHYKPELTPTERAHRLTLMLARVAGIIHSVIQERYCDKKSLALWLANSSELLNFLKSDRHISAFSIDAQDTLADGVQLSFRYMVRCVQSELSSVMSHFFIDKDDPSHDAEDSPIAPVLAVLSNIMGLLRCCRVNAALTIQLFSQLFYFINVWTFNRLVASNTNYCSRIWGLRLKARLAQIEVWAERQGLELAADCHLARIVQAAHLLQAPKYNAEDLASLSSTCFKLNSLQLRALLTKYQLAPDEPKLSYDLIENVVRVAENLADELARSDCREVRLEEEPELALPFLLPEDGYSCEVVRGIPQGLIEFVTPLQHAGLCRLSAQLSSNGSWTVYMGHTNNTGPMTRSPSAMSNRSGTYQTDQQEPEIHTLKLHKSNNGMGLSIVAAKAPACVLVTSVLFPSNKEMDDNKLALTGAGQDKLGIYIKSVVKGGAADADGRLQAGDQLLKVDGQSLVGITQEKAAEYLVRTGPIVTLEVSKQGAIYHGLATLLSQPSPVLTRALPFKRRPQSELFPEPTRDFCSAGSLSMCNLNQFQNDHQNCVDWDHKFSSSGGRRMSERDLPSRVQNEQHNQSAQKPMHHPPIHSSKSVPSLNSTGMNDGQVVSPVASRSSHEVFNPGYSRTSSTNSIHQRSYDQQNSHRSRSNQNLNDMRTSTYPPQVAPHHLSPNRLPSNPNLLQNTSVNIPSQQVPYHPPIPPHQQQLHAPPYLYNQHQQQHPVYHQHVQQQQQIMLQQQQQQYLHQQSNQSNNMDNGERFYQNLSVYRNQENMHNGYMAESPSNNSMTLRPGKVMSPQYDRSPNQFQRSFRGSQSSLQQQPLPPVQQLSRQSTEMLPHLRERPTSAYLQKENYPPPSAGMSGRSQSTRDIMRQEAKLQEIGEEVRRREMRDKINIQSQQHYPGTPSRVHPPVGSPGQYQQQPSMQQLSPMQQQPPIQQHPPMQQQRVHSSNVNYPSETAQFRSPPYTGHNSNIKQPVRAGLLEDLGYRESPPPPPPPPTSTHPLYQTNTRRSPDNRYTASVGEPPRGGYYSSSPVTSRNYQLQGTNPWEREEREKEAEKRREVAKEWRDQQIMELLALGPNRNQSQEEQLRALKLEKEFERRAQEEDEEEEEDQEAMERVQDVMRLAREQDELRNTSKVPPRPAAVNYLQMNGTINRSSLAPNSAALEEKERLQRLKELKMKQAQLDSLRAEEHRLKQKEEELRLQGITPNQYNPPNINLSTTKQITRPTHLRLDNLVNNSSAPHDIQNHHNAVNNNSIPDFNNTSIQAPQERLDSLLEQTIVPSPPERGTSFAAVSQTLRSPVASSSPAQNTSNRSDMFQNNAYSPPKKVSFHESSHLTSPLSPPHQEKHMEDPNRFICEAESMLASPKSPDVQFSGSTPGVIGAQEVYKDPRQRRLAEQHQQKLMSSKTSTVPEKLTFKEKMKMFAMETGEDGTPRDKVKISKAQREIDNLNSPSTPNNVSNHVANNTDNV